MAGDGADSISAPVLLPSAEAGMVRFRHCVSAGCSGRNIPAQKVCIYPNIHSLFKTHALTERPGRGIGCLYSPWKVLGRNLLCILSLSIYI